MKRETREMRENGTGDAADQHADVAPNGASEIRVTRILTVGRLGDEDRDTEADATVSAAQRLDQLERLRRSTAEGLGHAYPQRLSRVLEVAEGP